MGISVNNAGTQGIQSTNNAGQSNRASDARNPVKAAAQSGAQGCGTTPPKCQQGADNLASSKVRTLTPDQLAALYENLRRNPEIAGSLSRDVLQQM
ncbi:hypothetical protein [Paraburkholderia humisilvae]|uniref:Uncharacterized protein n=1 Tax=Paraburkholderia humisilvae TaxID=627669 RepID=A0A6J5F2T9_9BURK|nr:hypothetical protein [Paraburkholderia humisilvae]CAB3772021.1 hypothetical protein LMG29542_06770 [Paraburkholderia humisilvae]